MSTPGSPTIEGPSINPLPWRQAAWACAGLTLWLVHARVQAMPGVDEPPLPQPAQAVVVPEFAEQRLPNGLRVVVARRAAVPLVTVLLQSAGGAATDPPSRAGLSGLAATLLTKGTVRNGKRLDATQIARQAEALGSTLDSGANWYGMQLSMTVNTAKVDSAVALIADVARRPTFPPEELERSRAQAVDGLKVALSDPGVLAGMVARRTFWGTSAYGTISTPTTLGRITRQDVMASHAQTMRQDRSTLIFAGDITLARAVELARGRFGDWRATRAPALAAEPPGPARRAPHTVVVNLPGAGQTSVVVTAPFIGAADPERRTGQVASAVLGGGYSARLNQEVRIKRGLAYGASAHVEAHPARAGRDPGGMLTATTQTGHPNAAAVAELVRAEVLRLGKEAPSAEELAARQATLVGGFARALESTGGLAGLVADQLAHERELKSLRDMPQEVWAVTADDVREFAAKHFTEAGLRTIIVGDVKQAGEALDKLDERALRVEATRLNFETAGLE